ncbi:hypothetical protein ACWGJ9_11905 [Curtobacterium citreum]
MPNHGHAKKRISDRAKATGQTRQQAASEAPSEAVMLHVRAPADPDRTARFADIRKFCPNPLIVERYMRYPSFQESWEFSPDATHAPMFVWGTTFDGTDELTMNPEAATELSDDAIDAISDWATEARQTVSYLEPWMNAFASSAAQAAAAGMFDFDLESGEAEAIWGEQNTDLPHWKPTGRRLSFEARVHAIEANPQDPAQVRASARHRTHCGRAECEREYLGPLASISSSVLGHQLRVADSNGRPHLELELAPQLPINRAKDVRRVHRWWVQSMLVGQQARSAYLHAALGLPQPHTVLDHRFLDRVLQEAN